MSNLSCVCVCLCVPHNQAFAFARSDQAGRHVSAPSLAKQTWLSEGISGVCLVCVLCLFDITLTEGEQLYVRAAVHSCARTTRGKVYFYTWICSDVTPRRRTSESPMVTHTHNTEIIICGIRKCNCRTWSSASLISFWQLHERTEQMTITGWLLCLIRLYGSYFLWEMSFYMLWSSLPEALWEAL